MQLCSFLGLVACVASGIPLNKIDEIEPYKIAQIGKDIHFEQLGKDLIFRKVTGQKAKLTEDLLEAQSKMPAVVLFAFLYEDKVWYAEETDTGAEMEKILDSKVDEPSYRYVFLGAHLITEDISRYTVKMGRYRGTLLVEIIPTPSA